MFDGFIFWDFGDKYIYERRLCDLLVLVEDCLIVYLRLCLFFVWCVFELSKCICVEVKLDDLLDVVFNVLNVNIEYVLSVFVEEVN